MAEHNVGKGTVLAKPSSTRAVRDDWLCRE